MCHPELCPIYGSHLFSKAHRDLLEENMTRRLLSLFLDFIFRYVAFSDSFSLVSLLMQYVTTLFQSRE